MTDVSGASIEKVRDLFATALRGEPAARGAWVSSDEDGYHLWLLVEPSDMARERQFYALIDPLYDAFPETGFMLHVLNPSVIVGLVPERIIPATAVRVDGSAAA